MILRTNHTIKNNSQRDKGSYKDKIFAILQEYGPIDSTRNFKLEIQGETKKCPILVSKTAKIDLIQALKNHLGYNFSFLERKSFNIKISLGKGGKNEVFYNPKERDEKGFFPSLFHEIGHGVIRQDIFKAYPRTIQRDEEQDLLEEEKNAWIKSLQIAKAIKDTYNLCTLAGFQSPEEIYNYTKKYLKTHENR